MAKRAKKSAAPAPAAPEFPVVVETFRKPGWYEQRSFQDDTPSCWNGDVRFRRYRITFEEIPEPAEVLGARLQALWDESDNHYHHDPLERAAAQIGYVLRGERGEVRRKREEARRAASVSKVESQS